MTSWKGVSVVTRAAGELITVAKLKARTRIDVSDDDVLIADFLRGAIALIDGPAGIGYAMMMQTWRKSMDCFPRGMIMLPGAPIKNVTSITYIDTAGNTQTLDPAEYRVDLDSEPGRIEPTYGRAWPAARDVVGSVKVDYVLGEDNADDVPASLIDAVCLVVGHRYQNREAIAEGSMSEIPMGFSHIVEEYRRGQVAG